MLDDLVPFLIVATIFGTIGWIVHIFVDGRRRRERIKVFTEFHSRLLDRMGSTTEFSQFLQTSGGERFLDSLSLDRGHPADRIARALQLGIILTVVGTAMFMASHHVAYQVETGYIFLSTIVTALGIGFLLSSIASYFLSRAFGLLKTPGRSDPS